MEVPNASVQSSKTKTASQKGVPWNPPTGSATAVWKMLVTTCSCVCVADVQRQSSC